MTHYPSGIPRMPSDARGQRVEHLLLDLQAAQLEHVPVEQLLRAARLAGLCVAVLPLPLGAKTVRFQAPYSQRAAWWSVRLGPDAQWAPERSMADLRLRLALLAQGDPKGADPALRWEAYVADALRWLVADADPVGAREKLTAAGVEVQTLQWRDVEPYRATDTEHATEPQGALYALYPPSSARPYTVEVRNHSTYAVVGCGVQTSQALAAQLWRNQEGAALDSIWARIAQLSVLLRLAGSTNKDATRLAADVSDKDLDLDLTLAYRYCVAPDDIGAAARAVAGSLGLVRGYPPAYLEAVLRAGSPEAAFIATARGVLNAWDSGAGELFAGVMSHAEDRAVIRMGQVSAWARSRGAIEVPMETLHELTTDPETRMQRIAEASLSAISVLATDAEPAP